MIFVTVWTKCSCTFQAVLQVKMLKFVPYEPFGTRRHKQMISPSVFPNLAKILPLFPARRSDSKIHHSKLKKIPFLSQSRHISMGLKWPPFFFLMNSSMT